MFALVLDHRPSYLGSQPGGPSLLMLPFGPSSVLDQAVNRVMSSGDNEVFVVPTFDADSGYADRVLRHTVFGVKVVRPDQLAETVRARDDQEMVVVLDPTWWPDADIDWNTLLASSGTFAGVRHVVAVAAPPDSARETVECARDGSVRRVRRVFERAPRPQRTEVSVMVSLLPCRFLEPSALRSLAAFRDFLSSHGVLSRDEPITCAAWDLRTEQGLLAAISCAAREVGPDEAPPGFRVDRRAVFLADGAVVDSTAKLVGPVFLYPRSRVAAGATIVGPAVVGTEATVEHGAAVAHSVLGTGAVVRARAAVRGRVVSEAATGGAAQEESGGGHTPQDATSYVFAEGQVGVRKAARARNRVINQFMKRLFDVLCAGFALLLLSPLLLLIAILIRLDSRGPIFFGHGRERNGGREFRCFKFRTMVPDADRLQRELAVQNEVDGPQFKMRNDPRVTRMGRFLRATNLDELPQLWNVLLGHMSLVGPRPSPFRENQICVPWRQARLSVRPGITGLWQVCRGNREQSDFNQWIYYDMMYVRHFSFWLDIKILAATVLTLGGKWSVPASWLVPAAPRLAVPASPAAS